MKRGWMILLVLGVILSISCSPATSSEKSCSADTDCVKATCCHATKAVSKENAPNCSGQICTMDCEPDTLDCGQGKVQCVNKECSVVLSP